MGKIEKNNRIHNNSTTYNSTKISSKNKTDKKYNIKLKSGERKEAKIKWKSKLHMIENSQILAP
jgi:hypothetical protein